MVGGFICPHCRRYTARGDKNCIYCGKYVGPEWLATLARSLGYSTNPGTKGLLIAIVAMFIAEVVLSAAQPTGVSREISIDAMIRLGARVPNDAFSLRSVSAIFLHGGLFHVCFNIAALLSLGPQVEERFGTRRMLAAFAVTGVIANLLSDFTHLGESYVALGASGALYGLDGVLLGVERARGLPTGWKHLRNTAVSAFALAVVFGFDFTAHASGFLIGVITGAAFQREWRPFQNDKRFVWLNASFVAAAIAAFGVSIASPPADAVLPAGACPAWTAIDRCRDSDYVYASAGTSVLRSASASPFLAVKKNLVPYHAELHDVENIRSMHCDGTVHELLRVKASELPSLAGIDACAKHVVSSFAQVDPSCPEWASKGAWKEAGTWFVVRPVASENAASQVETVVQAFAHMVIKKTPPEALPEEALANLPTSERLVANAALKMLAAMDSYHLEQPDVVVTGVKLVDTGMCQGMALALYSAQVQSKNFSPK